VRRGRRNVASLSTSTLSSKEYKDFRRKVSIEISCTWIYIRTADALIDATRRLRGAVLQPDEAWTMDTSMAARGTDFALLVH
jgi:hypothetical protein